MVRYVQQGQRRVPAPVWQVVDGRAVAGVRPPDEQDCALLDVLTGVLDRIATVDTFTAQVEAGYRHRHHYGRRSEEDLASPVGALAIAHAHGAPSHLWALRWLSMHATEVARWQASAAIAWANGTGGPIPIHGDLYVTAPLPKNPGKKREALMAQYGACSYDGAMRAVIDKLRVDAPSMPVPGLGDVVTELRANRKENHRVP